MGRQGQDLETLLIENKPTKCELCGEKVYYLDGGQYQCRNCEHIMLDDFGKVKEYIEAHGPAPAMVIESATGVKQEVIDFFLKKGRVEIPEGSKYYIKCEKCRCSIRYGRFCPDCIKETAGGLKAFFSEEVGEKPKIEWNPERKGKIHFIDRRWK